MDRLFLGILNMSITASYVILIVIAARLFLKKAPKVFSYALWSVVLFRLICPLSFESMFSLIPVNARSVPQNILYTQTPEVHSGIPIIDQAVNHSLPGPMVGASANPIQIWIALGEAIWFLGIAILLIYAISSAVKLHFKLRASRRIFDNVYEIASIRTPFVFGFIRPKVYLPVGLSEKEKAYILKHEQTHIKRFDHIIKPFAYLVLCIHWFNPLVWVAFFLMSEDMELSCDESVIRQMGSEIKKDYLTSLLSLSTGKRMIGGSPLAFVESNTKGRIMNLLNYKKPAFWAVIVGMIVVVAMIVGLMSNPQKEQLTVEDYANQLIQEEIQTLEGADSSSYKIIENKITRLEEIAVFDHMLPYPIEIWVLEYRLKPDDLSKVRLAGGMNEIDGWITEDSSMGKPMLIFSYETSHPEYLGTAWSGESDFTTPAGQETALRIFLEGHGLLPHETYSGNHTVVKFPLSTGETCQLFLSQPAVQGKHGIWCAERWMDGNGAVYYITPNTDQRISDYYKELQNQVNNGHKPGLLDPLQVAIDWINHDLGQRVTPDQLNPQYSATAEDFMETPESHFIGYISNFEIDEYSKPSFHLDPIEWLTLDDAERLKELNINPDDLSNGFYIYNSNNYPMFHQVTDATTYHIINWGAENANASHKPVTMEEFLESLEQYSEHAPPYHIVTKDGYVQSITEQYVP